MGVQQQSQTASVILIRDLGSRPKLEVGLIFHKKFQKWLPPGGHIELGEPNYQTARREVLEETGHDVVFLPPPSLSIPVELDLQATPWWTVVHQTSVPHHPPSEFVDHIFVASLKGLPPSKNPEYRLDWFAVDNLDGLDMFQTTKILVDEVFDSWNRAKHQNPDWQELAA